MTKKRIGRRCSGAVVAMALCAAVIAGCGGGDSGGGASKGGDPISIGFVGPLSGSLAGSFGTNTKDGAQFAIDKINKSGGVLGRQLKLVSVNDSGDPQQSRTAVQRLTSQDVHFLISGATSAATLAHEPVVAQNKMVAVTPVGSDPHITAGQTTPWYFALIPNNTMLGQSTAQYALDTLGVKKVAVFERDDAYGQTITTGFVDTFKKGGGAVTRTLTYPVDAKDFGSNIASALGTHPDALFLSGYAPESGLIAKQARAAGFRGPLLATNPVTAAEYSQVGGAATVADTYASSSTHQQRKDWTAQQKSFTAEWKAANGGAPNDYELGASDCINALVDAIKAAGTDDPEKVRASMVDLKPFEGAAGHVDFNPDGSISRSPVIVKWDGKQWIDETGAAG